MDETPLTHTSLWTMLEQLTIEGVREHQFLKCEQKKGFGILKNISNLNELCYEIPVNEQFLKKEEGSKVTKVEMSGLSRGETESRGCAATHEKKPTA